eukprot:8595365-Karenia_brevis.AAC.1
MKQGPLPSIHACVNREERLQHPPAWGFLLPPGPRGDDGDLINSGAAHLALSLALVLAGKAQKKSHLERLRI